MTWNKSSHPRGDVFLVTVTPLETRAVFAAFGGSAQHANPRSIGARAYFDLG